MLDGHAVHARFPFAQHLPDGGGLLAGFVRKTAFRIDRRDVAGRTVRVFGLGEDLRRHARDVVDVAVFEADFRGNGRKETAQKERGRAARLIGERHETGEKARRVEARVNADGEDVAAEKSVLIHCEFLIDRRWREACGRRRRRRRSRCRC